MDRNAWTTKLLTSLAASDGPGIQYVVMDQKGVLYERAMGLADVKENIPMSPDYRMAAFSMTKTLTAIAILQLAEQGKLDLDAPVSSYIRHPYDQAVTIRQLLIHTSGIPNPIPLKWVHLVQNHDRFNEHTALEAVLAKNLKHSNPPGEKHRYSNINYWLLGDVIEAVSKQGYADYIGTNIFERLHLSPEQIGFTYSGGTAPYAKGYLEKFSFMNLMKVFLTDKEVWGGYEGSWLHIKAVYVNGPAYGGAIGTARAFGVILQDLLEEQSILLSNKSRELLFSPQKTNSGREINMTLGWHVGSFNGIRYFYKEGGGAGFHSEMRIYPSQRLASVIMTNRTSFNSRKALNRLDGLFLAH